MGLSTCHHTVVPERHKKWMYERFDRKYPVYSCVDNSCIHIYTRALIERAVFTSQGWSNKDGTLGHSYTTTATTQVFIKSWLYTWSGIHCTRAEIQYTGVNHSCGHTGKHIKCIYVYGHSLRIIREILFFWRVCVFLLEKNLPALAGTEMALHIDRHKISAIFMLDVYVPRQQYRQHRLHVYYYAQKGRRKKFPHCPATYPPTHTKLIDEFLKFN